MLAPYRWICDYADVKSDVNTLAEKMVMTGNGVEEVVMLGEDIVNVLVGKILSIEKHPDADKLVVCSIDIGKENPTQIVTGATNVFEGAMVPVACATANLPGGTVIKKGKLRGVESFGMLCSGEELQLSEEDYPGAGVDGIWILGEMACAGMDIREYLELSGAVIDFEVGANRPDCLSMLGVAREAAAADGVAFRLPDVTYEEHSLRTEDLVSVEVQDADLCTRYIAAAVTDVKIEPSPQWMKIRLREAGIRPINNIVDITNFVMLETGQPMHAFDAEDIGGKKIIVRRAKQGEKMKTLDDKERIFDDSMLLICDANEPIGVAGVMGGLDSEIKESTKTVVFEAAKFMYGNIRQTSRKLGLATESSMRFSKGVDATTTMFAMQRALTLIDQLGAGTVASGMIDILNEELTPKIVKTTASQVNAVLGTELSAKEMQQLLNRIFINTGLIGEELICTIPSFRGDIAGANDIAEEVARMFGYDNLPTTQAHLALKSGTISPLESKSDRMRSYLIDIGFFECVTYSFTGVQDYEKLGVSMPDSVALMNPMGDDSAYMRTSLIPHMLHTVAFNLKRKNSELRLFEIAKIYLPAEGEVLPDEVPMMLLALSNKEDDFFSAKGMMENIVLRLCGKELECKKAYLPYMHPGVCADLFVGGKNVGVMGSVHPDTLKAFELSQDMVLVYVNLRELFAMEKEQITYKQLPKYPSAARDIAVIVDTEVGAGEMLRAIKKAAGKRAESVELFDVYTGEQVEAGKKSVAYSLTLRAQDATLKDEEIDKIMEKVLKVLQTEFSATLRD